MKSSAVLFLVLTMILFLFLPASVALMIIVPIGIAVLCDLNGRYLHGDNYKMSDAPDR